MRCYTPVVKHGKPCSAPAVLSEGRPCPTWGALVLLTAERGSEAEAGSHVKVGWQGPGGCPEAWK